MKYPQIIVNNKWQECKIIDKTELRYSTRYAVLCADGQERDVLSGSFRNFYTKPEKETEDIMRMPK